MDTILEVGYCLANRPSMHCMLFMLVSCRVAWEGVALLGTLNHCLGAPATHPMFLDMLLVRANPPPILSLWAGRE